MCRRRKPPSHNRPRPDDSATPISSRRATHGKSLRVRPSRTARSRKPLPAAADSARLTGSSATAIPSRFTTHGKGFSSIHRGQPEATSRARRRGFCPFGQLGRRAGGITTVSRTARARAVPPPRFPPRRATHGNSLRIRPSRATRSRKPCPPPRILSVRATGRMCRRYRTPCSRPLLTISCITCARRVPGS